VVKVGRSDAIIGSLRNQSFAPEATTLVESMLCDDKGDAWFATECLSGPTKSGELFYVIIFTTFHRAVGEAYTQVSAMRVIVPALQPLFRGGNNEAKMFALKVILGLAHIGG
jgi:hypothetical protein